MPHDVKNTVNDYFSIFSLFILTVVVILIIFFSKIINKKFRLTYILLNLLISNLLLCFSFRLSIMYTTFDIPMGLCKTQSILIGIFGNTNDFTLFLINLLCYKILNKKSLILEKFSKIKFVLVLLSPYLFFSICYVIIFLSYRTHDYSFNEIFCFGVEDSIEPYLNTDVLVLYVVKIIFLILDIIFLIKIIMNLKKEKKNSNFAYKMISYISTSLLASLISLTLRLYLIIKKRDDDYYRNTNWPYRLTVYSYTVAGYLLSGIYIWNSGLYKYCKKNKNDIYDIDRESINELSEKSYENSLSNI
jgi:hypothetical protein